MERNIKKINLAQQRMNPNVNDALWVIMTCQYRSIHCNICATLVKNVDKAFVGVEGI